MAMRTASGSTSPIEGSSARCSSSRIQMSPLPTCRTLFLRRRHARGDRARNGGCGSGGKGPGLAKDWMIAGTGAACTSATAIFSSRAKISRVFLRNAGVETPLLPQRRGAARDAALRDVRDPPLPRENPLPLGALRRPVRPRPAWNVSLRTVDAKAAARSRQQHRREFRLSDLRCLSATTWSPLALGLDLPG